MRTRYLIIVISILLWGNAFAQSANVKPAGIRAVFSEKSIEIYQQNSMLKVSELYQYLTLYSSKASDNELKQQLSVNILLLFLDKNIKIYDFLSPEKELITITALLNKIENKSYQFTLKPPYNSVGLEFDTWINRYNVLVTNDTSEYNFTINQKVHFSPIEKSFGTKSKTVWNIKLGEILQ